MAARQALAPPRRPPPGPAATASRAPAAQRQRAPQAADTPTLRHDFARIALLAPGGVQAKRNGAAGGDACERQADQVAEQVAGGAAPPRGPLDAVPAAAAGRPHEALVPRGSGQPLAPALRGEMEARLGHDFGHVRIHADAGAAQAARAIDARAYAAGHDIVFAAGQYAPETPAGRGLLAHELTHVVQQSRSGAVVPQRKGFLGAIGGFFNSFFHIAFDYSDKAIRKYLKVLEDTHQIEGDPDSDDMARQIVRDGRHRGLSLEIRTLLVAEMLDGPTLGADERAIIAILRSATAAERAQIVASQGRDAIWENFSGDNLRAVQALTLTAADMQDAAVVAKLEALSESALDAIHQQAPDAAVQVALGRMLSRKRHELGSYPEAELRAVSQGDPFNASAADSFSNDLEAAKLLQNKAPAVNQSTALGAVTVSHKKTVDVPDLPLPPGVAIEFETRIAKANRRGLERIARHLLQDGPDGIKLPLNLTRNLAIREMGMVFRYTRFAHAGKGGATELVLIEEVGPLPPATELQAADWDVGQARPGAMAAGVTQIRTFEIRRDADWTEPEWNAVTDALKSFPDSVLKELVGVNFRRRPCEDKFIRNGVCIPKEERQEKGEAGERTGGLVSNQVITLFNDAFATTPTRYGLTTLLVSVLAHEVGHQVEQQPLDQAQSAFETGRLRIEAERDAALKQPEPRTKGKGRKQPPAKSPHELVWDKYSADRAALQAALDGARGLSGVAWKEVGTERLRTDAPADTNGDFLQAAMADGLKLTQERVTSGSISGYAAKNVVEQFADLFAMYLTDPELLQAIRPHVFAYFSRRFPT